MKKILVIQQKMIGDVLTSTILLEALRQCFPQAQLHYLVNKNTVPVVENNPFIDNLVINASETRFSTLKNQIKSEKYDAVIDVYSKMKSALWTFFSDAPIRVGIDKKYLRIFYTHTFKNQKTSEKKLPLAYENRLRMLTPLKCEPDYSIRPKIYLKEAEKEKIRTDCLKAGLDFNKRDYLMINALGSEEQKTYPLPYMATLLDTICQEFPQYGLLLNYIPAQRKYINRLIDLCSEETQKNIHSYFAERLRSFITLTYFCKAVIGNEGGAINMAKALNIPTFAIFSPWIRVESWGSTTNEQNNVAVHLRDYRPELFVQYHSKTFKKKAFDLYNEWQPSFMTNRLLKFIQSL